MITTRGLDNGVVERGDRDGSAGAPEVRAGPPVSWGNRVIALVVVLVALVAGWFVAAGSLPSWWARRVGGVSDGSGVIAVAAGLACGVAFTVLPLLLVRVVLGRRPGFATRIVALVVAVVLALPDLVTLMTTIGADEQTRTARQVLDLLAPGFRGATLAGAVLGAVAVLAVWVLLASRRRRGRRLAAAREELHRRRLAEAEREIAERETAERGTAERGTAAPDGDTPAG